ncbi:MULTISPECIES: Crp/Fnr family transcriptional regulator [unclassified Bradyrhizobium]|uniref:Crp/Fnr family transcriptional regulator n=1 Tax=unclassified Bradyrhizobium TaxID=2631580 RepID=UPI002FF17BDD
MTEAISINRTVAPIEYKAAATSSCVANGILRQLTDECRAEILARSENVPLAKRQILLERNVPARFAYFVEGGAVSLFARAGADRAHVEIGTLGVGDFIGIPIILGARISPYRCIVQVPGHALRINSDELAALQEALPELRRALLAYVNAAFIRSSQLLACNTKHSLRERLARWLLVTSDLLQMSRIPLTHDVLSRAIAVRRAGVTTEIGRMEEAGLIHRERGSISILDREGLASASCSCYRLLRVPAKACQTGQMIDAVTR